MVSRILIAACSIALVVAALVFAIVRISHSGGGSYDVIFLALGLLAVIGAIAVAASLVEMFRTGDQVVGTAVGASVGTAAVLVVIGIAAGLRG
jgi:hypothetical protein